MRADRSSRVSGRVPGRANYVFSAVALLLGALIFLTADNLDEETRRGLPLWLLGVAGLAIGAFGLIWTAAKRRR